STAPYKEESQDRIDGKTAPKWSPRAAATSQGCELPPSRATPAAKKFPARASGAPMKQSAKGHLSDGPLGERSVSIASDIVSRLPLRQEIGSAISSGRQLRDS